jgi:hypothetical protein
MQPVPIRFTPNHIYSCKLLQLALLDSAALRHIDCPCPPCERDAWRSAQSFIRQLTHQESKIMNQVQQSLRGLVFAGLASAIFGCSSDVLTPSGESSTTTLAAGNDVSSLSASLRLRCERRTGRSKISVDGNNLTPRNGTFRARVNAAGGTVTSPTKRAVGDEAEFDFDSNPNDVAQGATRISSTFIARRSGPDVVGEILNAQGQVVARAGVECLFQ